LLPSFAIYLFLQKVLTNFNFNPREPACPPCLFHLN
jgi:hypothetical protein